MGNLVASPSSSRTLQIGIAILTVLTAAIHFFIGLTLPSNLFILNGIGYLSLLAAYLLPMSLLAQRRSLIRWAFIGYTAFTILAWLWLAVIRNGDLSPMGLFTKAIEVLLIIALFMDGRK
jgi:hypothetical protein